MDLRENYYNLNEIVRVVLTPVANITLSLSFVSLMILVLIPYSGIWDWKGRLGYLLCT